MYKSNVKKDNKMKNIKENLQCNKIVVYLFDSSTITFLIDLFFILNLYISFFFFFLLRENN